MSCGFLQALVTVSGLQRPYTTQHTHHNPAGYTASYLVVGTGRAVTSISKSAGNIRALKMDTKQFHTIKEQRTTLAHSGQFRAEFYIRAIAGIMDLYSRQSGQICDSTFQV